MNERETRVTRISPSEDPRPPGPRNPGLCLQETCPTSRIRSQDFRKNRATAGENRPRGRNRPAVGPDRPKTPGPMLGSPPRDKLHMPFKIGVDENGLGARLGLLVVTGVLARATDQGLRVLARKPPKRLRADLADSKAVVSHGNVTLGEAWARVLASPPDKTPAEVFDRLSLEGHAKLRAPCPSHVEAQCWSPKQEAFVADDELLGRLSSHLALVEESAAGPHRRGTRAASCAPNN